MSKLSAVRVRELRACNNPVFDELLDFVQEMSDEYQKWICELEGPTPSELLERIEDLKTDVATATAIVADAQAEALKMKDAFLRTVADFDNYKKRVRDTLAAPFEVVHTCVECGAPMHRPVSLWRCTREPAHTAVGPEIAFELRERPGDAQ